MEKKAPNIGSMPTMAMAQSLKSLKRGQSFEVVTEHDRNRVLAAAKVLYAAGAIDYEIITNKIKGGVGFNVIRLPANKRKGIKK